MIQSNKLFQGLPLVESLEDLGQLWADDLLLIFFICYCFKYSLWMFYFSKERKINIPRKCLKIISFLYPFFP